MSYFLILYGIIGTILIGVVALKPRLFWPILIMVTVGTAGVMVGGKYTFLDEYLAGCILFGGFLAISMGATTLRKSQEDIWNQFHRWIFLLMVVYMIAQSFRGLIVLESLRKIRWVVYYGMWGIIAFIISKKGFPVPNARKLLLIISGSALVYLIIYLAHGVFTEVVRGISRFEVQPGEWSTSAYALFPLVITVPSAIFLIRDRSYKYRQVGWATLIVAILASFYYFSRVGSLVIFGFLFVSLFKMGFRRVIFLLLCFIFIFSLYFGVSSRTELAEGASSFFRGELLGSAQSILSRDLAKVDVGRMAHLQSGFVSIMENWKSFLFGYGFRTHGFIIGSHLAEAYEDIGLTELAKRVKVKESVSTEGFSALLIDAGLVGMLFLGANFLFVARDILFKKKHPHRIILLLSLLFAFLWLLVINMVDIMLFYLMIMPNGLLLQLSRYPVAGQPFEGELA